MYQSAARTALAVIFLLFAALAASTGAVVIILLPDALATFDREPEDVYLSIFWFLVLLLLAWLWGTVGVKILRKRFVSLPLRLGAGAALVVLLVVLSRPLWFQYI